MNLTQKMAFLSVTLVEHITDVVGGSHRSLRQSELDAVKLSRGLRRNNVVMYLRKS